MSRYASKLKRIINSGISLSKFAEKKGLYHLMSANFLARFLGFASQILVAWILAPVDMGRIKVMQTFMSIFIVLAGFGFNISILKLCSEKRSQEEKNFLFWKGIKYSIISQVVTFLIVLTFAFNGWLSNDGIINKVFIVFAIGIFPLTFDSNFLSYLQSLKKIKEYSIIQVTTKIIGVTLVLVLTYLFALEGYVVSIIIGYVITLMVILIKYKKIFISPKRTVINPFKLHFNLAYYSTLTNFLGIISISIDILVLNYFFEDKIALGYYSFASIFIGMLSILTRTVMQIAHPHFSEKSYSFSDWYTAFKKYNKLMVIYLFLILIICIIMVPIFLKFALSGKYEDSIIFFLILIFGWFFRDLNAFRGSALFGLGKIKTNFIVNFLSFLGSLIAVFLLFKVFGIMGAAYGMVVGGIITCVLSNLFFRIVIKDNNSIL